MVSKIVLLEPLHLSSEFDLHWVTYTFYRLEMFLSY